MPKMEIELKKEVRELLVGNLKKYFWNERDEELSNLGAELLLDFIVTQLSQSESYRRTLVLKERVLHQYAH